MRRQLLAEALGTLFLVFAGCGAIAVNEVRNGADLIASTAVVRRWTPRPSEGKWTPSLLPGPALEAYLTLESSESFTPLETLGDTTLGMVSGNNRYFAISPARAAELGLTRDELLPLSPPGSRHLRGMTLSKAAWTGLGAAGSATYLFRPPGEPSKAAQAYIDAGEALDVHKAYKCKVGSHSEYMVYANKAACAKALETESSNE